MASFLAVLLIFLAVSLGITAGFHVVTALLNRGAQQIQRRVQEEFRAPEPSPSSASRLFQDIHEVSLDAAAGAPGAAAGAPRVAVLRQRDYLKKWLRRAGVALKPWQLLGCVALLGATGMAAGWQLGGPLLGGGLLLVGAAVPPGWVVYRGKARHEKLVRQLPGAFDLMSRVIRTGQSATQALQAVAETFEEPIAGEFARCHHLQTMGVRPEIAFQELAQRTSIIELRIFAMAMLVQRQIGGNLTEVLERLASLVRARLRIRRKVRTLTAEGRLQAGTLIVLPFVVFAAMMFINRPYAVQLLDHVSLLLGTCVSMLAGALWIHRIVSIDD